MIRLVKSGITMTVRDEIQLAAFLNNGWEIMGEVKQTSPIKSIPEKTYTRTGISRMPVSELKNLAEELEISENTGTKLKAAIIAKLNL